MNCLGMTASFIYIVSRSQSIKITGQTNVLVLKIMVVFLLLIENLLRSKV